MPEHERDARRQGVTSSVPQWRRLDRALRGGLSEGAGWVVVGALNAGFVALWTPEHGWHRRLVHHAVDLAHFALIGALAAVTVSLATLAFERGRLPRAVRTAVAIALLTLVGRLGLEEDLSNLLLRIAPPWWLPARELVALILSSLYLAWRRLSLVLSRVLPVWTVVLVCLLLVSANAILLPADYPGLQLFGSACVACVASVIVSDRRRIVIASVLQTALGCAVLCLLCGPALLAPVGSPVWRSLLRIPTSVAAPFLSRLLAAKQVIVSAWIHSKYPEWFEDRSGARDVPANVPRLLAAKPLVILFTIESLRADVVLSGKYDGRVPALAKLRDESIAFTMARTPASSTVPAFAAIFSGKYYSQLYWSGPAMLPIEDATERWPSRLTRNGVHTIRVSSLKELRGDSGIATGFVSERQTSVDYVSTSSLSDLLTRELDQIFDRPAFAFLHAVESHASYHREIQRESNLERYLVQLEMVDREIARLREYLARRELAARTILIVAADHGEGFGEHGLKHHGRTTYDELLHVPLLVHVPGLGPKRISVPVSLIDLGPTILDVFGLSAPGHSWGQSLIPLVVGRSFTAHRPIAAESSRRVQTIVYPDGVKAVRDVTHQTLEIYDLARDPFELHNLHGASDFPHERYTSGAIDFFEAHKYKKVGYETPYRKF